jgi:hypothetical protein
MQCAIGERPSCHPPLQDWRSRQAGLGRGERPMNRREFLTPAAALTAASAVPALAQSSQQLHGFPESMLKNDPASKIPASQGIARPLHLAAFLVCSVMVLLGDHHRAHHC